MKKANVLRLVQSILIVLLSAGIIGGNSMIAYAQNASAEEAVVEEVAVTEAEVVAETENVEAVSELEAVEVEETLAATEAASGEWGNIAWSYANGVLKLSLKEGKSSAYMNEPDSAPYGFSSLEVCEMVAADYPWGGYRDSITNIIIGNGITTIGYAAFYNMPKLESVDFSVDIYKISYYAFANCTNLKKVTLPAKLSSFYQGVFYNCTSLEEVTGNVMLSVYSYYGCSNLKSITLPQNLKSIPKYAFGKCTALKEVINLDSCKEIDSYAFEDCKSLTNITLSETCDMYSYAFIGCSGLKEATVGTTIANYAFQDCTSLVKVNLPQKECTVYSGAFYNCTSLTEITGNTAGIANAYVFYNCKSLKYSDSFIEGDSNIFEYAFYGCTNIKEVEFEGQYKIYEYAFYGCTGLTKVVFDSELNEIGKYAFANCGLKEVWLDEVDWFTYGMNALSGNPDCKVYAKLACSKAINLAEDNDCIFVPTDTLPQPVMSTISNASNGVRVTWDATDYAHTYKVYRSTVSNGTYSLIKSDVNATEYIDTSVTPGVTYYYKIIAVGELAESPYSEASEGIMHIKAPTFKKIVNVVSGVHVYWNAADGAKTYSVYRSTSKTGDYVLVKSGLTATHYIDTTASSGKTYYYRIVGVNGACSSAMDVEPFKPYTYVGTPDITSRINKAAGVELGWNKIEGATGYAIYRKPYVGGSWARITTISGNDTFTYTDGAVKGNNGTIYRYTVRALAGSDMKTLSGCRNTGRTMVRLSSRTLNSAVKASATSIKCNWSTSAAVSGYEVRFMIGNTVYKTFTVGNYKTGAKTFTGLPSGYNYKVQVRAYKKVDGVGSFYSAWSTPKYVQL